MICGNRMWQTYAGQLLDCCFEKFILIFDIGISQLRRKGGLMGVGGGEESNKSRESATRPGECGGEG